MSDYETPPTSEEKFDGMNAETPTVIEIPVIEGGSNVAAPTGDRVITTAAPEYTPTPAEPKPGAEFIVASANKTHDTDMTPEQIQQQNAEVIKAIIDSGKFNNALIAGNGYWVVNDGLKPTKRVTVLTEKLGIVEISSGYNDFLRSKRQEYDLNQALEKALAPGAKLPIYGIEVYGGDNRERWIPTDIMGSTNLQDADLDALRIELASAEEKHKNDAPLKPSTASIINGLVGDPIPRGSIDNNI